ncbi:MAG: aminopeptidase P family protein [Anaerolineaceae bacterium]|nr:aminopeptidase P family protein [Anaerolineaceae bacterium]MBN2676837.1 aminopeptidase P family protein [Anaerolineaceae bacterium]
MKKDIDRLMRENDLSAILVIGPADHNPFMYYFTGGHHISAADLIKIAGKKPVLFHSPMEREEAAATGLRTIGYNRYNFMELLKQTKGDQLKARTIQYKRMFADLGLTKGRIMLYGKVDAGLTYEFIKSMRKTMPGIEFIGDVKQILLPTAMLTKDSTELARIRAMGVITTRVVGRTAEFLTSHKAKKGRLVKRNGAPLTIGEVKSRINLWLAEAGVENPEGTIFSIGRDAGIPHSAGTPNDELSLGKTIIFDIFPCEQLGGYFYDFTRTWCLGYAPDEAQRLYQDVKHVYDTVVSELKVNSYGSRYQHRACELFAAQGHPTIESDPNTVIGYNHSLGHGIGLNIHEKPFMGVMSKDKLVKGSTFTIEPGLYYPDKGLGVRIEDSYSITPDGRVECLADYPFDLVLKVKGK